MKVSAEQFETFRLAIEPLDTPELREQYQTGAFPRSDQVNDLDTRYRWDLFWVAWHNNRQLRDIVDGGLKDSHINTALRRIVPPLEA